MPKISNFQGTFTLYTDKVGFKGPINGSAAFKATFNDDGSLVIHKDDFTPMSALLVDISLAADSSGQWVKADGTINLVAHLLVKGPAGPKSIEFALGTESTLTLRADAIVKGKRLDSPAGSASLAGFETIQGGSLNGTKIAIQIDGSFTPNPRQP